MRQPLFHVDDLPEIVNGKFGLGIQHPKHADEIRPVIGGSVAGLKPGVPVVIGILAAVSEITWGYVAPGTIEVSRVVAGEMPFSPLAVDHFIGGVKAVCALGKTGGGGILVVDTHPDLPRMGTNRAGLQAEGRAEMLRPRVLSI